MLDVLNIEKLKEKSKDKTRTPRGKIKSTISRARRILKILERDNYRCIVCGDIENLTIDHINGRKQFKYDNAQKYKLEECQTLCLHCHIIKNGWEKNVI